MNEVLTPALVTIVCALIVAAGTFYSHRTQKGTRENAIIDQMQEIVEVERKARTESETNMRADITKLQDEVKTEREARESDRRIYQSGIRVRDGYISHLRYHIDSGKPPPAPDWPPGIND